MYICRVFIGRMYHLKFLCSFLLPQVGLQKVTLQKMNPKLTETYFYSKRHHQEGSVLMFSPKLKTTRGKYWRQDRSRRKKSSNTLFYIVIVLLSPMVFRQLRFVITTRSNSDFSLAMRSDERRLKPSSCIVRSLINATIQGFHRDKEMPCKARRLFVNHSLY